MNILFPFFHLRAFESFKILLCDELDHEIYLLDNSWKYYIKYDFLFNEEEKGWLWLTKNEKIHFISYQEFLESNKIDIIIANCTENYYDILCNIWPYKKNKCKFITYFGNEYIPYMSGIPFQIIKNHISADVTSHNEAIKRNVNSIILRPPIDYNIFKYKPVENYKKIKGYIHNYFVWKSGFDIFNYIKNTVKKCEFSIYGKNGDGGILIKAEDVANSIYDSCAQFHVKDREGYGLSLIENLACGRPPILFRPFIKNKALTQWCTDKTSIIFDTIPEGINKINRYLSDKEYAIKLQENASEIIRKEININTESEKLKKFLGNLR